MNLQKDSTKYDINIQEAFHNWNRKILPHLPDHMDEMAYQSGILQRKRGIHSAVDLLKVLFLYASSKFSFRILAASACALSISGISDTAWRKHLVRAVPFLHELLHAMLSSFLTGTDIPASKGIKNVLLVDASVIRQEGRQQEQQRIHLCYSLNRSRMEQIKVTDKHTAESLTHFVLGKGDLVMADAGYGTAQNYIYSQGQNADVILRITPKTFCLYDMGGEKISLVHLLKDAEKKHMEWVDVFGFCRHKNRSGFARVVAQRLPENQAEKAKKRRKGNASRKQRHITADALLCAGWVIVLTSLGAEYSGEEIMALYRSRWQVELLFKRFKQNFSVTAIKAGSTDYAEAVTLLWLIIWTITERQAFMADCFLTGKQGNTYSTYEKCKISFLQVTEILHLSCSLFIDLRDEKYSRYLSKKKRWRINQEDEFHSAVLPRLPA